MNNSSEENYPRICLEVGLTCQACTEETGRQLAQVCKGLRGKLVGQLFTQIHPHAACAPMHAHFAAAYDKAGSQRAMAAVA